MKNVVIYWTLLSFQDWDMYVAATSKGLAYVGSENKPFEELAKWAKKRFPKSELLENSEKLELYTTELIQFLMGLRKNFTFSLDYDGTAFQVDVWDALCGIPYGKKKTYSDIANEINRPKAVRAIGAAIGANPILMAVPCHRVLGKNGSLTGYRGGLHMKTRLLDLEQKNNPLALS